MAANALRDAALYHGLQPQHMVPVEAPRLVQKQLNPGSVAKHQLKVELSELWTAEQQHKPVTTTAVAESHVKMSRSKVAGPLLRSC